MAEATNYPLLKALEKSDLTVDQLKQIMPDRHQFSVAVSQHKRALEITGALNNDSVMIYSLTDKGRSTLQREKQNNFKPSP